MANENNVMVVAYYVHADAARVAAEDLKTGTMQTTTSSSVRSRC